MTEAAPEDRYTAMLFGDERRDPGLHSIVAKLRKIHDGVMLFAGDVALGEFRATDGRHITVRISYSYAEGKQ